MQQDGDFNIINQGNAEQDWFVTKSMFHPSFHTEAATPFLMMANTYEKIILSQDAENSTIFQYKLGFAIFNILLLLGSIYFLHELTLILKIKASMADFFFFFFSTAYLYFSIFFSNVLEIYSCFFISYLLLMLAQLEIERPSAKIYFAEGALICFSALFKPFNLLLTLPFIAFILFRQKKQKARALASLLVPIALGFGAELANRHLKFGQLTNPMFDGALYLMSYDLDNFVRSVRKGYLSLNGLFAVNLSYLIGFFGIAYYYVQKRYVFYKVVVAAFLLCYLLSPMFFLGNISEDHLPGRIFINILPLLLLGYIGLMNKLNPKTKLGLQVLLFGIHFYYLLSFIYVDSHDTYAYPAKYLVEPEKLLSVRILMNDLSGFTQLLWIGICSFVSSTLIFLIWQTGKIKTAVNTLLGLGFAGYLFMTLTNLYFSQGNIRQLEQQNFFKDKAVASGAEAYVADYVLDAAYTFLSGDNHNSDLLQMRIDAYFRKLTSQIETNDPLIKDYLFHHDLRLSFWVRENQKKMNSQK